jgi:hypothetical protein
MRRMTLMYSATEGETERADRESKEKAAAEEAKTKEAEALAAQQQSDQGDGLDNNNSSDTTTQNGTEVEDKDSDGVVEVDRPEEGEVADKEKTELQEDLDDASVEEVKEQINEDTPAEAEDDSDDN